MAKKSKKSYNVGGLNGLSSKDLESEVASEPAPKQALFEFTCNNREYDPSMDSYCYHVTPVGEYEDLDFEGRKVLINGRERLCDKFTVDEDGKLTIIVYCRAG
jgi:hypothetical protein